jgi:hypothetical protein
VIDIEFFGRKIVVKVIAVAKELIELLFANTATTTRWS